MRIIFSAPFRLGLDRPLLELLSVGRIYTYLADGLNRSGHKISVITPGNFDLLKHAKDNPYHGLLFDSVASLDSPLEDCDVFIGVGCCSLHQMMKVKQHGGKVATTWFNCHWSYAQKVLQDEATKIGATFDSLDPLLIWRCVREQSISDRLIVPSNVCGETYEAIPELKGKVRNVGLGVNYEPFRIPDSVQETLMGFRVLYAGSNWLRKGVLYLVTAWNHLHLEDATLTIMGSIPPFDPTKLWNTNLLGWVSDEDAIKVYQQNHVFVFPSLEEGAASAIFEAMSAGLAIITTRMGSADMIEDGVDGIIVEPKNPDAIAQAIKHLHDNPEEREKLGRNARAKVQSYPWTRFGDNVVRVLEEMV